MHKIKNENPLGGKKVKFFFFFLVFGLLLLLPVPQSIFAQQGDLPKPDNLCIGAALAEYMNGVIAGAGELENVKLFSPVFNITDTTNTPAIVQAMIDNDANFNGIDAFAANTYTLGGVTASQWFTDLQYGVNGRSYQTLFSSYGNKKTTFTEFGNALSDNPGDIASIKTQYDILSPLGTVQSLLLFDPLDTNQDPQWDPFNIGAGAVGTIISSNPTKGGVNSAAPVDGSGGFSAMVLGVPGARWQLEIVNGPGDLGAAVSAANAAIGRGIIPIFRICTASCGFSSDPTELANFIRDLDAQVNGSVWVVAGPNEPESELWATPGCVPREEDYFPKLIACEEGAYTDPEFHSLRPYPASPCDTEVKNTALLCGNNLIVRANYEIPVDATTQGCTQNGSTLTCTLTKGTAISSTFNFNNSKLPIAGNTELVPNGFNDNNILTSGQRTNQYVSWYLNGVTSRAEERNNNEKNAVNFSGPLRKLLSWYSQRDSRVVEAGFAFNTSIPELARHNQIAGCVENGKPTPCYQGGATPDRHRLTEWLATIVGGALSLTAPRPPSPEDTSLTSFADYWVQFQRWLGRVCGDIGPLGEYCSNIVQTNPWWATLFSFIPTSTTEDRVGEVALSNAQPTQNEGFRFVEGSYLSTYKDGKNKENLYFSHMQENLELARQLQYTFASKDIPQDANIPAINDIETVPPPPFCEILHSRTNPGDNLWARNTENPDYENPDSEGITAEVSFTAEITCQVQSNGVDANGNLTYPPCKVSAWVANYSVQTETPEADNLWNRLVGGQASVFRMIYPKVGEGSPVDKIKDLPGSTTAQYQRPVVTSGDGVSADGLIGNPQTHAGDAQIFFPHLGGISDYFLKGIQRALRPKGFVTNTATGQTDTTSSGGTVGNCQLGSPPWCDVNTLLPYLGNDITKATNASQICGRESGGNPDAQNLSCENGGTDYSIGLFQINLLAHCPGAFVPGTSPCQVADQSIRDGCVEYYKDPINNINKMVELSKNGTNWTPWLNASWICGIIKR